MSNNPNLKQALVEATELGMEVRFVRRTGEISVWDPVSRDKVTVNSRKKSTPRALLQLLKRARERKQPPREYLANRDGTVYWSCAQKPLRRDHPGCSRKEGHDGPHMNQWGRTWARRDSDDCAPKKSTA